MQFNKLIKGPYDCQQSAIVNISSYYGYEYAAVALGKIFFMYLDETQKSVGQRIIAYHSRKDSKRKELLGLKQITRELPGDLQQLTNYINREIPVVVWTDLYDCNWSDAYKKYHFRHCYLVYGEKNDDEYFIADPYFGKCEITQYKKELLKMSDMYDVYLKADLNVEVINQIKDEIKEDARYYFKNNMGINIFRFCCDLIKINLLEECDYPNTELYAVPLLDNLKIISQQRASYAILVNSISKKSHLEWEHIADNFNMSSLYWEKIRFYLIKMLLKKNEHCNPNIIQDYLYKIKDIEERSFEELLLC